MRTALILAGGRGTRLRPLTDDIPKPLVPLVHVPFLSRLIDQLRLNGFTRVVLALGYQQKMIRQLLTGKLSRGVDIGWTTENEPLGTGGAILRSSRGMEHPFLILNADIVTSIPFRELYETHLAEGHDLTIAGIEVEDPSAFGVLEYDSDKQISRFLEKPAPGVTDSRWVNAGAYVVRPSLLEMFKLNEPLSMERDMIPHWISVGFSVKAHPLSNIYWRDIGTHQNYWQANMDMLDGRIRVAARHQPRYVPDFQLNNNVTIRQPVSLGDMCTFEADAVIGPNVVLGAGSHIGRGSHIENSVLWGATRVGSGSQLRRAVLGRSIEIPRDTSLQDVTVARRTTDGSFVALEWASATH